MNDQIRAAIIAVANAFFPMLVILGVVDLTGEQVAYITGFITTVVTLIALLIPAGQQQATGVIRGTGKG